MKYIFEACWLLRHTPILFLQPLEILFNAALYDFQDFTPCLCIISFQDLCPTFSLQEQMLKAANNEY